MVRDVVEINRCDQNVKKNENEKTRPTKILKIIITTESIIFFIEGHTN